MPVGDTQSLIMFRYLRVDLLVIGATGKMALMRTVAPRVFVSSKQWLAAQPDRDPLKRGRDQTQAQTVQTLMDDGLLHVQQSTRAI
jgi:hypothetical protein